MARLESDKKLGFFPTNSATVNEFLDKISITGKQENFLVCDPCCGEGVALSLFKRFSGVKTYGVELDTESKKASLVIDELINDDGLRVIKSHNAFGFLFLNPPYGDTKNIHHANVRLETEFVKKWAQVLLVVGICCLSSILVVLMQKWQKFYQTHASKWRVYFLMITAITKILTNSLFS
ncbi:DUF6094 domain-containing protein [uncultured Helicobacter sp.]|uniref:DUF6094 domain-containing protein n=1 Tax=uncultured Helicobacter sp. TaxID=175537 RepID=UPI002637A5CB|nr:DUF6094 domain-containing protein [uncultured Helicobacter sp.]